MSRYKGVDLSQVMCARSGEIATLYGELYIWMKSEAFQPTYPQGDISMTKLYSAALQLSIHTIHYLVEVIDWEASRFETFSYVYKTQLPRLLVETLTPEDWYKLAVGHALPHSLADTLRNWITSQPNLKLKLDKVV